MKAIFHGTGRTGKVRTVATFGDAQLVRNINGRYELRGGSATDHTEAMEWISIFLHEAVVSSPPPVPHVAFCEPTINRPPFNIRHSGRAASPCHESREPWVNVFGYEDLNCRLTNREPPKDCWLQG
jgi:hypothetical protein